MTGFDEISSSASTLLVLLFYGKDYDKIECSPGDELMYGKKRRGRYPVVVWGRATRQQIERETC
jgi:hypothetical protein